MIKELITIKDYAKKENISVQAVYKKLKNNKLIEVEFNKKKYIAEDAEIKEKIKEKTITKEVKIEVESTAQKKYIKQLQTYIQELEQKQAIKPSQDNPPPQKTNWCCIIFSSIALLITTIVVIRTINT